jgi:hypothetical protein
MTQPEDKTKEKSYKIASSNEKDAASGAAGSLTYSQAKIRSAIGSWEPVAFWPPLRLHCRVCFGAEAQNEYIESRI